MLEKSFICLLFFVVHTFVIFDCVLKYYLELGYAMLDSLSPFISIIKCLLVYSDIIMTNSVPKIDYTDCTKNRHKRTIGLC